MKRLRPRIILASLAAATAVTAVPVPTASADVPRVAVWLNEQTGVLSITGTPINDYAAVSKQTSANAPGGYVLVINVKNWEAANFSANCTEGGGEGDWMVTCPALNAEKITFDGGPLNDSFINNTDLPSVAYGDAGIDFFKGGSGPDVFYGGADNDNLAGNGGDDMLDGGAGFDTLSGGDGTDLASWEDATGPVTASLDGVANDGQPGENENIPADVEGIQGGPYADHLSGSGLTNDTLLGGGGDDDLEGWSGDDVLRGQDGNDTLHSNSGADVLDGGPGTDSLSYAADGQPVYVYQDGNANDGMLGEHDNVTSIENLTGSAYNDELEGTAGDDVIHGGAGSDKIDAKFGDDVVYGDAGNDSISGGPGTPSVCPPSGCNKFDTDTVFGGTGSDTIDYSSRSDDLTIAIDGSRKSGGWMENDTLSSIENANGGSGNDTIYGNGTANSLSGGPGDDGIVGAGGNDYITGDEGNDFLEGDAGNDWITGGIGNDTLQAAGGNDSLYGGPGTDTVGYYAATGGVIAHIGTGTSGQSGEADTIGSDVENLEGSSHNDKLYGSSAANKLIGDNGADLLVGNGGADTLQGGAGPDTLQTSGDGLKDLSSCGSGGDVASADKVDTVAADCETVHRS